MDIKTAIFLSMVFCHIVDDFYLQGWLASAKQKKWWAKNAPQPMYKYDYVIALQIHSFSWAFVMMLPLLIYQLVTGVWFKYHFALFLVNMVIHQIVDNAKANKKKINLVQDQAIHIVQIAITYIAWGLTM